MLRFSWADNHLTMDGWGYTVWIALPNWNSVLITHFTIFRIETHVGSGLCHHISENRCTICRLVFVLLLHHPSHRPIAWNAVSHSIPGLYWPNAAVMAATLLTRTPWPGRSNVTPHHYAYTRFSKGTPAHPTFRFGTYSFCVSQITWQSPMLLVLIRLCFTNNMTENPMLNWNKLFRFYCGKDTISSFWQATTSGSLCNETLWLSNDRTT